jgi:hypothetical protein
VAAYPTLLFFNPNGELVHKVLGAQPVDNLLIESEKALNSRFKDEVVSFPTIRWENPLNQSSNTVQGLYNIKCCIQSKKPISSIQVYVNGSPQIKQSDRGFNVVPGSGCDFAIEQSISLSEGSNQVKIVADNQDGSTTSEIRTIFHQPLKVDKTAPNIKLITPQASRGFKLIQELEQITVVGQATDESGIFEVTVNGTNATVSTDGTFQSNVFLAHGDNTIIAKATDNNQNSSEFTFYINRKSNKVPNNLMVNGNNSKNERRIALIIGNADYKDSPLRNPVNDAKTVAEELNKLGFNEKQLAEYSNGLFEGVNRQV